MWLISAPRWELASCPAAAGRIREPRRPAVSSTDDGVHRGWVSGMVTVRGARPCGRPSVGCFDKAKTTGPAKSWMSAGDQRWNHKVVSGLSRAPEGRGHLSSHGSAWVSFDR